MARINPRLNPRVQGDMGEASARDWLASKGYCVYVPLGHSPDIDLMASRDGEVLRIEVKTSSRLTKYGTWDVQLSTHGGNQSWTGVVKRFDRARCDYLFVHVADGRRWFIPTSAIRSTRGLRVGGVSCGEFEIEPGRPLVAPDGGLSLSSRPHLAG